MSTAGEGATADGLLTPAHLGEALRSEGHDIEVTAVDVEPVGTGQMGSSFRLRPTYAGDHAGLPATFVAKVAGGDPSQRAIAAGAYRTEVNFYRRLAPTVAVRVPRCWHSWTNEDGSEFLLLLDDLAPATQGDQLAGCPLDAALAAVVNLAGLHGPRWCDPTLVETAGLSEVDTDDVGLLGMFLDAMTATFLERFSDDLHDRQVAVLRRVPAVIGRWLTGRVDRFGPVHGDYRLDNLMFGLDGAVTALDWQTVSLGLPARDVAFFCSTSLTTADRRAHEGEIVAAYHDALVGHGVGGYPLEQCVDDYGYSMLQAPLVIVLGWAVSGATERGDRMFLAMTERACTAIEDHGTFDLVP